MKADPLSDTDGGVVNLLLKLLGETGVSSFKDCCSIFDFFSAAEERVDERGFLEIFGADFGELTLLRRPLTLLPIFLLPFGLAASSGSFDLVGDFALDGLCFVSLREGFSASFDFDGEFALF